MGGFAGSITFTSVILKGFKWGFAAFVVALGAEYFLDRSGPLAEPADLWPFLGGVDSTV